MGAPILPRSLQDPLGLDALERRAIADFNRRVRAAGSAYLSLLDRIPFDSYEVNVRRYEFRLLPSVLSNMIDETNTLIDRLFLDGGLENLWFLKGYVEPAVQRGTELARVNLAVQSTAYAVTKPTLQAVLLSEPYQRRLGLVAARQFEEMKGLSAGIKRNLAQTLTAGLAAGLNPRDIAKNIEATTGIEASRARRIARTEIGQALRTARLDEAEIAAEDLGVRSKMLWLSAMSPTTRETHARRSGKLYTRQEVKEFYTRDGNAINCKCAQTEVLVDDAGNPLTPSIVERAQRRKLRYLGSSASS